jgi:hypothetical protein
MTVREELIARAQNNGLFPDEAKQVMDVLIAAGVGPMSARWDDAAGDYPLCMLDTLWGSFKKEAAKWLAENKPKHWARYVFDANERGV